MLEVIGLTSAEEELYRCLVQLTRARVEQLAERLHRPRTDVLAHLDALRAKGLVQPVGPEPDAPLRPLAPDVPLGGVLLRQQEALETARASVTQLAEEYRTAMRRHDAEHLVEVITGARVLRERLRDLQNAARVEVLWFCRANPLAMPGQDNVEEFHALARGVRYRAIYEREMLLEPGALQDVEQGVRAGEQARVLDRLPVRLAIVDARTAVCPLVPDRSSGEPSAAVIGRSQLLDALLSLFESHWRNATPLRSTVPPAATAEPDAETYRPDADEARLLSLFVAGVPDKSIASQLGVSRRTVQRRLADLMAVAGVDTRPGLAFQVARRGWI
ncbi:helix-turn-helix domain-containing protein [Verrucosispora sp. WMMD573]|uniref:helix-turn-helix domain-containing protein n=1 Tax=Verrucosispora sp. WMMD573 TaxID=3015149 RepID=UPI00248D366D|nr:helix-turn-helix domain-containing protein [Verrucosispora sp. WMMD573]WBB52346.1 TrmB family transcriptional regulator [Verrucosispora sp. WMMD573]